jgi:hypothetical protein
MRWKISYIILKNLRELYLIEDYFSLCINKRMPKREVELFTTDSDFYPLENSKKKRAFLLVLTWLMTTGLLIFIPYVFLKLST